MQKPKKTIRIPTNYYLQPTEDHLQNEEEEVVVLEDVRVEQDSQIPVDQFQNDDQYMDVEVGDLVDVVQEVVEFGSRSP